MEDLQGNTRGLEGRLARLEEKMDLMLERTTYGETCSSGTPKSASSRLWSQSNTYISADLPPRDAIVEVITVYFQQCHMQPLWLFDRNDLVNPEECSEEVILSLLALALRHSSHAFFEGRSKVLSEKYAQLAREYLMFRIAQGSVKLSTIQSLCMLTFANLLSKEMQLASLHLGIATTFAQSTALDVEVHHGEIFRSAESRRRVFWSIHFLNQIYGHQTLMLNVLKDIQSPNYLGYRMDTERRSDMLPPSMPQELQQGSEGPGIWAYMVQLSTLWRQVRTYMTECTHSHSEPPWSVNSGYAVIGAHLMDLETSLPFFHRYDSAKFGERSTQELHRNRTYWSPWLYLQFTYHTIHSMLNHPFLYSSKPRHSAQPAVPNTFWKTSSELALIHTTWIVRLVDMVSSKDYQVSDPFIGHCVAIAGTIQIYFCGAPAKRARDAAQVKLATCLRFLGELAELWPVCQMMHEKLQALIQSAVASNRAGGDQEPSRRTVSINTRLMWEILDYTFPSKSTQSSSPGLFHESLSETAENANDIGHTVETQIFHVPAAEPDTSDGGQALPPYADHQVTTTATATADSDHSSVRTTRPNETTDASASSSATTTAAAAAAAQRVQMQYPPLAELANSPWAFSGNLSVLDATRDPFFQFQDIGSPFMGLWEVGSL